MDFREMGPKFDDDSLCLGKRECSLCDKCSRLRPKKDFDESFLLIPPGHMKRCAAFKVIRE